MQRVHSTTLKRAGVIGAGILAGFYGAVLAVPLDGNSPPSQIATCPAPAPPIIPIEWRKKNMSPGSRYYEALFSPAARRDILGQSTVPLPSFSSGRADEQTAALARGEVFVGAEGPRMPVDSIDWTVTAHGRYYATQLHGLVGIGGALSSKKKLPDTAENSIAKIILNWGLCAAHNEDINPRAWYEGTVVKRQRNLLAALNYVRRFGQLDDLQYEEPIYLIDQNVNYLLDTKDIYSLGNHGIRQDMLLAATALSLPRHPRAGEMLRLATKRLDEAAAKLFSVEGIWLEHAPGYVSYTLNLMYDIEKLRDFSPAFNPALFLRRFDASADYVVKSLTPDLTIPWIGSSNVTKIDTQIAERLVHRTGKSIEEQVASFANTVQSFNDYGHAILRGAHPHGLYLIFIAAQNLPAGKRHSDDLSFILYNYGRVWITEGGHQTYERSKMTTYLRSPYAHNGYVLGASYVSEKKLRQLDTRLESVEATADGIIVTGFTERFPTEASVTRAIKVDKQFSTVDIADVLKSPVSGSSWHGRLHFPGDLAVTVAGTEVVASDPRTGHALHVTFDVDQPITFKTCKGQETPICGWGQVGAEFGPVTSLEYTLLQPGVVSMQLRWSSP